jgi:predicted dehydrogenase
LNRAAVEAGKHVYVEKPFAVTRDEARAVVKEAAAKGLRLGCAPDTFMGAGIQSSRKLIDDGWVGRPIVARAMIGMPGPFRGKHPSGDVFYRAGAGPLFDMAPYYLTALIALFGPVRRVTGVALSPFSERRFQHPDSPLFGKTVPVEVSTSVSAVLEFDDTVQATLTAIYDCPEYTPKLEVYGTDAVLTVSDPNTFGGPVLLKHAGDEPQSIPLTHALSANSRGIGILDMCLAQREKRSHRADGSMALHVLDVMQGIVEAAAAGSHYEPVTTCQRPGPLAPGPGLGSLDHFGC